MNAAPEKTPPCAATVLLLRDGKAGLEVLMITRHANTAFAGGALVFPGGRVDAGDADEAVLRRCRTVEGADAASMALRVAAIRETYEEVHILLARSSTGDGLLAAAALASLEAQLGGAVEFAGLVATGKIELATDLLVPFAHWITPAGLPKRFDTRFFLAPAPTDQLAAHDGREAVELIWITARKAIAEADAKRYSLMFATRLNLCKLGRSRTVAEALAAARTDRIVTLCPEIVETADGRKIRIPEGQGYDITEMPLPGLPRANPQR